MALLKGATAEGVTVVMVTHSHAHAVDPAPAVPG